jgi:hypothetical protein
MGLAATTVFPLAALLDLAENPGSSNQSCVGFLGLLDVDPDARSISACRTIPQLFADSAA